MESDAQVSRWARRESSGLDHARYQQRAHERAASTTAGTYVQRHAFTLELPARLVGGVTIHPWRSPLPGAASPPPGTRVDESSDLEVGVWCRTTMVGNGYASEAVSAIVAHALDDLRAAAVWIRIAENNVRSRRLAERLAFVEVERVTFPASPEWGDAATVLILRWKC